jgi:DNA-binding protein
MTEHIKTEAVHEPAAPEAPAEGLKAEDNIVFIGKKPTMNYVLAVITQFSEGKKEVHLKARGRSISTAVDVAEAVRNRFMQTVKSHVTINSQEMQGEDTRTSIVSIIDITLSK